MPSTSSRNRNSTSARCESEADRHAGNAAAASSTAVSTSWADAKSTSPDCTPVEGSYTRPWRPDVPGTTLPPTQCEMRFTPQACLSSTEGDAGEPKYRPGTTKGDRMAEIQGTCDPRFEGVQATRSRATSTQGLDVGASVAVILDGELVVDLWGGIADDGPHHAVGARHDHQRVVDHQDDDGAVRADARRSRRARPRRAGRDATGRSSRPTARTTSRCATCMAHSAGLSGLDASR